SPRLRHHLPFMTTSSLIRRPIACGTAACDRACRPLPLPPLRSYPREGPRGPATGEIPIEQVKLEHLRGVAGQRLAWGFLQDQEVTRLDQDPFTRVAEGLVQVHADDDLSSPRGLANHCQEAGRRPADPRGDDRS